MIEPRTPPEPFDLSVVTGFLGAGKTTLLNRLLRDPALADTLVLINEFGSVGLDHLLVERVDGDMLVMTSGCLCCSIRGDLVAALEDALRARDNGRMTPFTRVIIETTGLADPAPVLHTVMTHPYLRLRFKLRAVVTLVDALVGEATLDGHLEAVKQVALADRLVVTKTDLITDDVALDALKVRLRALNPTAPLMDAARGDGTANRLFSDATFDPAALGREARSWLAAESVDPDHGDHHRHDVNRHDARIRAFCLRYPRPVSPHAVSLFMELLRSAHGAKVLRFKGLIAATDDPGRPLVAHGVQHVMSPLDRLDQWPDEDRSTRLVFILQDLDPAFVENLWAAAAGDPRLDRPDAQAVTSSPLGRARQGLLG